MINKKDSDRNIENTYNHMEKCPLIYTLDKIGQKWKIPILWHLSEHEYIRYNELKRSIYGITNTMLTKSLQELEENGLINRDQYDTIPPKVEYSLTERGKVLIPILNGLHSWGEEQIKIDTIK